MPKLDTFLPRFVTQVMLVFVEADLCVRPQGGHTSKCASTKPKQFLLLGGQLGIRPYRQLPGHAFRAY